MRIVVNDIAASFGGAMTVLQSFYKYIRENDNRNEYIFLLSGPYLEETEHIKVITLPNIKKSSIHKLWFDFISGKKLLYKLNADRVISLQNIITFGYHGEQWVYLHQSIPFQTTKKFSLLKNSERKSAVYQYFIGAIIKRSVRKADHVFVQTHWMKNSVTKQCKIADSKIDIIPVELQLSDNPKSYYCDGKRFFYPSAGTGVYKNHKVIFDAISVLEKQKVYDYSIHLTLPTGTFKKHDNVKYVGYLSNDELDEEYSHSILLFPSYVETVGLPLVEAMLHGALIIAADCEYAHEVLCGYSNVVFFDPFDAGRLAELMLMAIRKQIISDGVSVKKNNTGNNWNKLIAF